MSVRQLIPSLGKELDDLYARISYLEGILGVGVPSEADRSCKPCGITWQLGLTCFPQHMAGRRHNKMLMAKQSKNSPQLNKHPKKQSITPSYLVSNVRVRSKPPPLFPFGRRVSLRGGESTFRLGTAGLRPQTRAQAGVAPSLRNGYVRSWSMSLKNRIQL